MKASINFLHTKNCIEGGKCRCKWDWSDPKADVKKGILHENPDGTKVHLFVCGECGIQWSTFPNPSSTGLCGPCEWKHFIADDDPVWPEDWSVPRFAYWIGAGIIILVLVVAVLGIGGHHP